MQIFKARSHLRKRILPMQMPMARQIENEKNSTGHASPTFVVG